VSTCTRSSADLQEPVTATAAPARTWLLIEQAGPWGAKALTSSHLDPAVGRELDRLSKGTGVRVGLIRRPGRHADSPHAGGAHTRRHVILAHTAPHDPWVRATDLTTPADLTELDFAALGAGAHGGFGGPHEGSPLTLVCTNGKRDRCCALHGRPLAAELAASGGSEVWETSHLGGHRFSPTVLVLPYGYLYGRVNAHHAKAVLEATRAGRVVIDNCRGRSAWERPGQAAELAVRALTGEDLAAALTVRHTEPLPAPAEGWTVQVAHTDGRAWQVTVEATAAQPPRPESCEAALGSPSVMNVTAIETVTAPFQGLS
jgi:hypothetical protein